MEKKIALEILPFLKEESNVFNVLKETNFEAETCVNGITLLTTPCLIITVMHETSNNPKVCRAGIVLLTDFQQILSTIKNADYHLDVFKTGLSLLRLEEKSENELLSIMKQTDYNPNIREACVLELKKRRSPFNNS